MKQFRNRTALTLTAFALAGALSACGGGTQEAAESNAEAPAASASETAVPESTGEPIEWVWTHTLSLPGSDYDQLIMEDLPQRLSDATNGQLTVRVISGETPPNEVLAEVQDCRVDGGEILGAGYGANYPQWNFGEVAFRYDNLDDFKRAADSVRDLLNKDLQDTAGVVSFAGPLPWTSTYIWTVDQALETAADWNGLKLRSPGIEAAKTIEAMGAAPVTMPFGEVYSALSSKTVDGFMSSTAATATIKPWEVTQYLNLWPMGFSAYYPVLCEDSFNALPDDLKGPVQQTLTDFYEHAWEVTKAKDIDAVAMQESEGITVVTPTPEELAKLQTQSDALYADWLQRAGPVGAQIDELTKTG
ncbi:MAG: TRAP transporter substrate-binding protein [Candidatus Nanopelagicales bacterium]